MLVCFYAFYVNLVYDLFIFYHRVDIFISGHLLITVSCKLKGPPWINKGFYLSIFHLNLTLNIIPFMNSTKFVVTTILKQLKTNFLHCIQIFVITRSSKLWFILVSNLIGNLNYNFSIIALSELWLPAARAATLSSPKLHNYILWPWNITWGNFKLWILYFIFIVLCKKKWSL